MKLPSQFLDNMKDLLKEDYPAWIASFETPSVQGLRINNTKIDNRTWEEQLCPFEGKRVPWTSNGYYYPDDVRPAKHPYYYAGLYYLQEPSAMTPAQLLPVKPGDRVLDLCAAPGGKSTELGAKLEGQGLLIANDISNSRARALLKNLELFGIPNICVTSEAPGKLADTFGAYFDKILVDAPCSGEGMFRKDPDLIKSWEEHGPEYYAGIQREILLDAIRMLKPGGYLLYSTCTFARMEDEDNIEWLLSQDIDLELCELPLFEGASRGMDGQPVLRLFPHKIRGEGHFVALLHKKRSSDQEAGQPDEKQPISGRDIMPNYGNHKKELSFLEKDTDFFHFESLIRHPFDRNRLMVKQDMVYYLPVEFDCRWKLRYLRTGLLLGELKKGHFEPSQALAMVLQQREFSNTVSFACEDERVLRYLKGETIALNGEENVRKGWCLVCVDGYPLGWAKCTGQTLKNKYYPGWRWQ